MMSLFQWKSSFLLEVSTFGISTITGNYLFVILDLKLLSSRVKVKLHKSAIIVLEWNE